ncbi:MAG: flagellar basal body protein, partial [Defluviitaleaceae bacterium]|nr:flagellar basal body protein [Defluviitaleaceae bacterium]
MGFGGLGIASSGMRAAQRNLNITGHNMANAEVQGFSRQRMIQKFAPSRSVGFDGANQLMQVGMGTDWTNVHQIRNEFLDINFRNNVSRLNFYSTVVQAGVQIETLLGELHGGYNFQTELNNIWYAIQELTSYPDGFHTRQFFLGNVTTFLTKAQEVFEGLFEYQQNLDAQIREVVNGPQGINATVAAIGELNDRIRFLELNGDMANDYRDQRNLLVDHLATLIPINVRHASNGDINITSLGHHILTGSSASPLGLRFIAPGSNLVEPVFTHERGILSAGTPPSEFTSFFNYRGPINSASGNDGGRLMALIHARGTSPKHHLSADVMPPLTIPALHDAIDAVYADVQAMMAADPALTFNDALNAALAEFEAENPGATTRDVQRFIPRVVQARFDANIALEDELILEMERDARAQAHNHAAHMWSVEHAKIPRAMMHLDRIVNTVATMINDALTGNLRGSDGNFLFFETDDPRGFPYGNPILAYERDAAGELILDEDGDP